MRLVAVMLQEAPADKAFGLGAEVTTQYFLSPFPPFHHLPRREVVQDVLSLLIISSSSTDEGMERETNPAEIFSSGHRVVFLILLSASQL